MAAGEGCHQGVVGLTDQSIWFDGLLGLVWLVWVGQELMVMEKPPAQPDPLVVNAEVATHEPWKKNHGGFGRCLLRGFVPIPFHSPNALA